VDRNEAIQLAAAFADANGYRVVPRFDGVEWVESPAPVKLEAARWINGEWAVVFDRMLAPEVESECPGAMCVVVNPAVAACWFYSLL
jgi:hypothetical protein